MRRIMVPHRLLCWVEVDLDSGEVADVHACDYMDNYESWPAAGDEIADPDEDVVYARGLCVLEDFPDDRDTATDEETIAAGRILADANKLWPLLRIEDDDRWHQSFRLGREGATT